MLDFDLVAACAKCSGKEFSEAAGPFPVLLDDGEGAVRVVEFADRVEQGVLGRVVDMVAVLAVEVADRTSSARLCRRSHACRRPAGRDGGGRPLRSR